MMLLDKLKDITLTIIIALGITILMAGCGIQTLSGIPNSSTLTPDQIRSYQDAGLDIYTCFTFSGPPPTGNVVAITSPRDKLPLTQFIDGCHLAPYLVPARSVINNP